MIARQRALRLPRAMIALVAVMCSTMTASPALADHVVVKRHVTLREGPTRESAVVLYPELGATFRLLDDGARQRGYYRIALEDGSTGWIYFAYVERRAGDPPGWPPETPVAARPVAAMAVHYIDVDQGAAALVEFPCAAILIDAGGRGTAAGDHLLAYLDAFFARRPDLKKGLAAVFVTHTHVDHNSNLRRIAERFSIGGYIHNGILTGSGRVAARWMDARVHQAPMIPALAVTDVMVGTSGRGLSNGVIDPV
ncbi:MBL fold metallo-hydrolase [Sphingobium sp. PNB]|uniref:MBL fold metallo-hydrolase n=1 Tax=Sphingobium sp. PNB TaxID=863934 RepID=UPI001CA3B410|nr:MBL fold metallo-hydrolase [Sphingobium sp. PNB]MCB4859171.1 MBL fold metallo-hydrolase [Sphingobium sp. PNB]